MTKHDLKELAAMGAELGAAKTENEKLRKALKRIIDRCEAFVDDEAEMRTPSVEVLMGIAEDAIYTVHEADVALSQQPEPTDTFTAVDMATAAAQGFRDGQAAVEPAPAQDERTAFEAWVMQHNTAVREDYDDTDENAPEDIRLDRQGGVYIWANAEAAWFAWKARSALDTRPAQTEQQPVAVPEGWKLVPVQPTAEMLAAVTTSTFEPLRQEAMKMAREDYQAMLYAAPIAQTEQQPAYVECRECTDCGHVGINDAHPTDATCAMCDWSGPSPVEDQCPDCGKENAMGAACPKCSGRYRILAETHVAAPIAQTAPQGKFRFGDLVRKTSGSEWQGRICGTYSTPLTPEGYAVESEAHAGSVQIYPAKALEAVE